MGLEDRIGTVAVHGGNFHSDEVFAIAELKKMDPNLIVVRTRNPELVKSANMRVDVCGEYCHEKRSYDHHQRAGAGKRENGVPYAAAGLIWHHYGSKICGSKEIAKIVDEELIQKIDSVDTGYARYDMSDTRTPYPLHYAIGGLNPSWQETNPDFDSAFNRAVEFADQILSSKIKEAEGKTIAREIVRKAIREADGRGYLVLDRFCPWGETAVNESNANYVLFQDPESNWVVSAVPKNLEVRSYHRKPLPAQWAGMQSKELAEATGVKDAIFCHNARFIAGAKSLEGARKLAELANANVE